MKLGIIILNLLRQLADTVDKKNRKKDWKEIATSLCYLATKLNFDVDLCPCCKTGISQGM